MRILTIDIGSYTQPDLLYYFKKMGIEHKNIYYFFEKNNFELKVHNEKLEKMLLAELEDSYDCVMTTNFFPVIARICHEKNVKYLSWSYDAPLNLLGTDEMEHPTNYIFLFDRNEVKNYKDLGFDNFYHLPLAVNTERLDAFKADSRFETDISLMGGLYESTLPALKNIMSPLHREFVDKIVETQFKIYGNWFVDEMLSDNIIGDMNAHFRQLSPDAIQISREELSFSIAQQITFMERLTLLKLMSRAGFKVDLYTYGLSGEERALLEGVNIHGTVDYAKEMPSLFRSSRINLNPTLKKITSGIPLRALDILGCGGFLLTNFQPEIEEFFEDGKEVVMYKSMEEALDKAKYFLSHEEERTKIAEKGYEKVKKDFGYEDRIAFMLKTAGLS